MVWRWTTFLFVRRRMSTHYSGNTWCCCTPHVQTIVTPWIGTKKQASLSNRRFQQPQYSLGIHRNKQRRRICGIMGGLKQPATHTNYRNHSTLQCVLSSNISDMREKSVLYPIPHTQHHPIYATVNPVIVPQPTTSRKRFNLKKAKWDGFSTEFDSTI